MKVTGFKCGVLSTISWLVITGFFYFKDWNYKIPYGIAVFAFVVVVFFHSRGDLSPIAVIRRLQERGSK